MKLKLSRYELALLLTSLSWNRKTHGIVLDCDHNFWWYRLKWWICGLLWSPKKDNISFEDLFDLEIKLKNVYIKTRR